MYLNLLFGAGLVAISGIAAGLTLGILTLDLTRLRIVVESGTRPDASIVEKVQGRRAARLVNIRASGNQLLITLLLVNVATNAAFSILMGETTSNVSGFLLSTGIITIVGELIPQAICSRYGLEVCSHFVCLITVWQFLLYPFVKPLSAALDWILGKELGALYSRDQLSRLIMQHNCILSNQEIHMLQGGLSLQGRQVKDVMRHSKDVFFVYDHDRVCSVLPAIVESGYSRIPVLCKSNNSACAILFAKDLLLFDGIDTHVTVTQLLHLLYGGTFVDHVSETMPLLDLFNFFKLGTSHMCVVRANIKLDQPCVDDGTHDRTDSGPNQLLKNQQRVDHQVAVQEAPEKATSNKDKLLQVSAMEEYPHRNPDEVDLCEVSMHPRDCDSSPQLPTSPHGLRHSADHTVFHMNDTWSCESVPQVFDEQVCVEVNSSRNDFSKTGSSTNKNRVAPLHAKRTTNGKEQPDGKLLPDQPTPGQPSAGQPLEFPPSSLSIPSCCMESHDVGIVTLEDVVECILQESIVDEFDTQCLWRSIAGLPSAGKSGQACSRKETQVPARDRRQTLSRVLLELDSTDNPRSDDFRIFWPYLYLAIPSVRPFSYEEIKKGICAKDFTVNSDIKLTRDQHLLVIKGKVRKESSIKGMLGVIAGPAVVTTADHCSIAIIDLTPLTNQVK